MAAFLRSLTGEAAPVEEEKEDYTIYEEDEDAAENEIEDAEMEGAEEGFAELSADHLSSLMAERLTEEQTAKLMERFAEVMRKCEEDGVNRDEELKQRKSGLSFLRWSSLATDSVCCSRRGRNLQHSPVWPGAWRSDG